MAIKDSVRHAETLLRELLFEQQEGVNDAVGKGTSAEVVIEERLIRPHLPPPFQCQKGAVVEAAAPDKQSAAIDRVVYDPTRGSPLVYGPAHSIFAIESVVGLVEITMRLNGEKLREDVERIAPVQAMRRRRHLVPVEGSITEAEDKEFQTRSPRGFLIGLPEDENWRPATIAKSIREAQLAVAGDVKIHGVYVIGIGYFSTIPGAEPRYQVNVYTDESRLFRFTNDFRVSFQRWGRMPEGWATDFNKYVEGDGPNLMAPAPIAPTA